jgi:ubiquinone/menaquinone biosynthesis C-methylase UbiE
MQRVILLLPLIFALSGHALAVEPLVETGIKGWQSTRVTSDKQHKRQGPRSYPYRDKVDFVMRELDLKPGDAVADLGCGTGFWTKLMAEAVGASGTVHAGEVSENKVADLKKQFGSLPQVKPYVCPKDGTGLPEKSCDLVYLSQTYHHLPDDRLAYLKHLRTVIKPDGRLAIIEKYPVIATKASGHGTDLSDLMSVAEQAGWIPLRIELMPGTYHYLAFFAQKELFPPEQ